MIANDQPTIFSRFPVQVAFSCVEDGSLAKGNGDNDETEHLDRLKTFLHAAHFPIEHPTKLFVRYGGDKTYRDATWITSENAGQIVDTDALYTLQEDAVLFLPVADCIATVVYDPDVHMLGILHLGRHSSVAHSIEAFYDEVKKTCSSNASSWRVWMSPSLRQENNVLDYFQPEAPDEWKDFMSVREDGKLVIDIPSHNKHRFELIGVRSENIQISPVDTYMDENYFSHRAANDQNRPDRQGRMVVAAMLLPRTSFQNN